MQRQMLKSKIHRATVTDCDLDYVGSITVDTELMEQADLLTNEQVHVWDIDNGARFETYVIEGEPGSGTIQVNGAAAHLTRPGDKVIVASFGVYDESDLEALLAGRRPRRRRQPGDRASTATRRCCSPRRSSSMSTGADPDAPPSDRQPVTLPRLAEMKRRGEPIVMVTAYDFPSAQVAEEAGVDLVLVGDTAAMVVLGYQATVPVSMDEMVMLGERRAARRCTTPLMIGDLPFGSYQARTSRPSQTPSGWSRRPAATRSSSRPGGTSVERARAIVRSGIPVMGHVGLTPQTRVRAGRLQDPGQDRAGGVKLAEDALALQAAGCFAIVFEAVPAAVTEAIIERLEIPVIGIGAGPATDGQVLVFHDLLGITTGRTAKFVKRYAEVHDADGRRRPRYADEVRTRHFPEPDHVYGVEPAELDELRRYLDQESLTSQKAWDWEPLP